MIPASLSPLANHLWQSTLFAALVALLTLALRKNRAQMRYWLWLAASVKFLIPFSLLVSFGSQFEWRDAPALAPPMAAVIEPMRQPLAPPASTLAPSSASRDVLPVGTTLLVAVWFAGCAVILTKWWTRWSRIHAALRAASPLPIQAPLKVMSSSTLFEPGVFGILRPVLLLPEGIANRLAPAQFRAVLAHEFCHVRRHDNLASAVHMVVETAFWFHPLVWWIGARMIEERERACDEEVLRLGNEAQAYAEGILNVCKFYLESPLACVSGVTGSDLKKRIEAIMTSRMSYRLTLARKLLLTTAGMAAVAGPVFVGVLNAPRSRAQTRPRVAVQPAPVGAHSPEEAVKAAQTVAPSPAARPVFDVASIRPSDPDEKGGWARFLPGGRFEVLNAQLFHVIMRLYGVRDYQIVDAPKWIVDWKTARFNIEAKAEGVTSQDQLLLMAKNLLEDRFQLKLHRETRELPVYLLTQGKNGVKSRVAPDNGRPILSGFIEPVAPGWIQGANIHMDEVVLTLSRYTDRPVLDRTNYSEAFTFKLEWATDVSSGSSVAGVDALPNDARPSLFTAVQEQMGLKLNPEKAPVEVLVIDHVERPSEN